MTQAGLHNAPGALYEDARDIFLGAPIRPTAQHMASLVIRGLTDQHLKDAWSDLGHPVPDMGLTMLEVGMTRSFLHALSDTLANEADSDDTLHIFAARDGEALSDDFAIAHPDKRSVLLPASTPLFRGLMRSVRLGRRRRFLEQYGVTRDLVNDPEQKLKVVDTGFRGSVGRRLGKMIGRSYLHGSALVREGRLSNSLVHADPRGFGTNIMEIAPFNPRYLMPKTESWLGSERFREYALKVPSVMLAISMQLHPRFHGTYDRIAEDDAGNVAALTYADECISNDVNTHWSPGNFGDINNSIVNPLAAAIVQRYVVESALLRTGKLGDEDE